MLCGVPGVEANALFEVDAGVVGGAAVGAGADANAGVGADSRSMGVLKISIIVSNALMPSPLGPSGSPLGVAGGVGSAPLKPSG